MSRLVLYLHSSSDLYGADQALLRLVQDLDKEKFTPLVILPGDGPLLNHLHASGVEVIQRRLSILHRTANPAYWGQFSASLLLSSIALTRLVHRRGVALIHSNTSHVLDGGPSAWLARVPHVWHIRELRLAQHRVLQKVLPPFFLRFSSACIAVTEAARRAVFGASAGHPKLHTVYDGVDLDEFDPQDRGEAVRREFNLDPDTPLIGMLGRIARLKGHDVFLQAAGQVHASIPGARFVIIGDAVTRDDASFRQEIMSQAQQSGLGQAVIFTGLREDIPSLLAALNGLVSASVQPESLGLVLLEAMAAGRPVIATAHGGPPEIVVHGETGLLIPPGNSGALAEAMLTLLRAPAQAQRMGQAGRVRCAQRFTHARTAAGVMTVYDKLLDNSQDRGES